MIISDQNEANPHIVCVLGTSSLTSLIVAVLCVLYVVYRILVDWSSFVDMVRHVGMCMNAILTVDFLLL